MSGPAQWDAMFAARSRIIEEEIMPSVRAHLNGRGISYKEFIGQSNPICGIYTISELELNRIGYDTSGRDAADGRHYFYVTFGDRSGDTAALMSM